MSHSTMRQVCICLCLLVLAALLASCSGNIYDPDDALKQNDYTDTPVSAVNYDISFSGNAYSTSDASAVATDGSALVLIKGGVYRLSGERTGQIQVSVAKTERVILILDGLTVTCQNSAALYVKSADRVYIEVPAGKTATFSDGAAYLFENPAETKPNACIYSADDLTFRGSGELIVHGNYNNGIGCKNDIVIRSGSVTVDAVKNAVKGNESVAVYGTASLTVTAAHDGIKCDSVAEGKGYILIAGYSTVSVTCEDDVLQATVSIIVEEGAVVSYRCEGQPTKCEGIVNVAEGSLRPLS